MKDVQCPSCTDLLENAIYQIDTGKKLIQKVQWLYILLNNTRSQFLLLDI